MKSGFAFQISEDDVLAVLCTMRTYVSHTDVANIYDRLDSDDFARIERAALDGGTEMDDQTTAAHAEIKAVLIEKRIIDSEGGILQPEAMTDVLEDSNVPH